MRRYLFIFFILLVSCDYSYDLKSILDRNSNVTVSTEAHLSSLGLTGMSFVFFPSILDYSITVPNSVASTQVTATLENTKANFTINGISGTNGVSSASTPLAVGANSITIVVTPQVGTPLTYTVSITRDPPLNNNANLNSLNLSGMTLTPVFDKDTLVYTAAVPSTVTSTTLTAQTAEIAATMEYQVDSGTVQSLTGSTSVTLGSTTVIKVTGIAQDLTPKVYTITVSQVGTLALSPGDIVSDPSKSRTIAISGGTAPYTVSKISGSGDTSLSISGSTLTFKAGSVSGDGVALVRDSAGNGAYLNFHIVALYQLYPAEVSAKTGSSVTFTPSGGAGGPYTLSIQSGVGSISPSGTPATSFTFTAGSVDATTSILAKDNGGSFYYIDAKSVTSNFGLNPSKIKAGTTIQIAPSGGTGGYTLSLKSAPLGTTLNGSGEINTTTNYFHISSGGSLPLFVPTGATGSIYIDVDDDGTTITNQNIRIDIVP